MKVFTRIMLVASFLGMISSALLLLIAVDSKSWSETMLWVTIEVLNIMSFLAAVYGLRSED